MFFLPTVLACAALQADPSERISAVQLAEEAQRFLPAYDGQPRELLTATQEHDAIAASLLLDAALHLDPELAYLSWWKGHAETLLAENARHRGRDEEVRAHWRAAEEALDAALAAQEDYYWAWYARGMVQRRQGRPWEAIADYDRAEELADRAAETVGVDALQVRFHARQWRADTRMNTLQFEQARDEFRAFYAANGNNQWDLGYSLAETHMREGDLAGARATYAGLLEVPEYVPWSSTYEQLAYIEGLLGNDELAAEWLERSFEHELTPGLYPRLWLWMFATGEKRLAAERDLRDFLANPPPATPAWDRTLGRFLLGELTEGEFLEAFGAERERRLEAAEVLDGLGCEVAFYAAFRHERMAETVSELPVLEHRQKALEGYVRALGFQPQKTKWEWEFARLRLARVARELGWQPSPAFSISERRLTWNPGLGSEASEELAGVVETVVRHDPGTERSQSLVGSFGEAPLLPGTLLRCVVRTDEGRRRSLTLVVGANRDRE